MKITGETGKDHMWNADEERKQFVIVLNYVIWKWEYRLMFALVVKMDRLTRG